MEGPDASLNWEWQDELLASLDARSPLDTTHTLWEFSKEDQHSIWHAKDTTHTLWEDINQSEGMLEMTPTSQLSKEDQHSIWHVKDKHGYPSEHTYEDSAHTKRRRMLNFEGEEEDGVFLCNSSSETSQFSSLENVPTIYNGHQNGVTQSQTTSSTSKWFNNVDDDTDVVVERCNDGDWLSASVIEGHSESQELLKRESQQELPVIIESVAISRTNHGHNISLSKMATPVAYPFSVVKPSGMQGDVTLHDINKRIMMVHDHPRHNDINHSSKKTFQNRGDGGYTSTMLPKSVVALTKIHTEGNGTITIMRTKN